MNSFEPPTLAAAQRAIESIRQTDLAKASIENLRALLKTLFTGYKVSAPLFTDPIHLFRGTLRFQDAPPKLLSDLWHPPPQLCVMGRANREHQPMLYCSIDRSPLFFELHAAVGDRLAIVQYESADRLLLNRVGYTDKTFRQLKSARQVPDYGGLPSENYDDVGLLVNDFLAEVFCEVVPEDQPWRYKISVAIAEALVSSDHFDGLLYPTVPMWGNADNIALKPASATAKLKPIRVEYVVVTKVQLPTMSFDTIDEARFFGPDGAIGWLGHVGQWQLRNQGEQLTFESKPGGYWEARDEAGGVVNPS